MFTGIIKEKGTIAAVKELAGGRELTIDCAMAAGVQVDQSIAINGVCHTVTEVDNAAFKVQSVEETLRKTNIGDVGLGDSVNLEPSLHPQQLLDGHLVQGHVDTTGNIVKIEKEGTDQLLTISYAPEHQDLLVGRGSITVDGISLTVAREQKGQFTVAIIPYTFNHTN